ncbi:hypothetical protein EF294_03800 [Gordonia oryzae]|uniref:Uncharacterized protein n=1 Tax=Gordonia oryzae TaxID=2487349 RepID=A0A3N4GYG0_9ACTN|nr:hypothetical protein EF294_03800 [Gordonia oryzae]
MTSSDYRGRRRQIAGFGGVAISAHPSLVRRIPCRCCSLSQLPRQTLGFHTPREKFEALLRDNVACTG